MRFRFHSVPIRPLPRCTINLLNLSSLKFQQNVSLPKEICTFPKLSARLWLGCYKDCENIGDIIKLSR